MKKLAIYGKGGIGKSTTASNLAAAFAEKGLRVMQIGCDPKADSTLLLTGSERKEPILDQIRKKGTGVPLEDLVMEGYHRILCAEAGGPAPGLGCAGRGIITAFETLEQKQAFEKYKPDIVIYDVLGDVVCGGFAMPIREGYADKVFIITSGENMAIHAAANIAMAVAHFEERGYASLGGIILNRRNVPNEEEKVQELAEDISSSVIGGLTFSKTVQEAEQLQKQFWRLFGTVKWQMNTESWQMRFLLRGRTTYDFD